MYKNATKFSGKPQKLDLPQSLSMAMSLLSGVAKGGLWVNPPLALRKMFLYTL